MSFHSDHRIPLVGMERGNSFQHSETDNDDHSLDSADRSIPTPVTLDAGDVMAAMIHRSCNANGWFKEVPDPSEWSDETITGVCLRSKVGAIKSCPSDHPGFKPFETAVRKLNVAIAIKIQSSAVELAMRDFIDANAAKHDFTIDADNRFQVLDTIEDLGYARKNQYAAFIRDEGVLVVWADRVDKIVASARDIENSLVAFLWAEEMDELPTLPVLAHSFPGKPSIEFGKHEFDLNKQPEAIKEMPEEAVKVETPVEIEDPEKAALMARRKARPIPLISPVTSGLSVCLSVGIISLGLRALIIRYLYDGDIKHLALAAVLPPLVLLCAFPCNVIVTSIFSLLGPISQFSENSMYYSSIPPSRANPTKDLPPITVQMPVYKESLDDVIIPTIESLKKATTTFERQGGSVNVIVCDDGLQLVSEEDRQRRIDYYTKENLAYVARPPHGKDGFLRRGRFKKAGNLNFANALSLHIEDLMDEMRPAAQEKEGKTEFTWSEGDESQLCKEALELALKQSEGVAWAAGNVRIGEIILMIDSDTRVPEDCFMDAALEMIECPEVAIIQHVSGVMQVAHHFFENGMAFFTRMIQVGISLQISYGDVAPFVGHNAFLRWSALQECAMVDEYDGIRRVWSESHVSEDFQVALNLQSNGWVVRWATYSKYGFEEGVSLTCTDELSRWQKYSYGCSEIIFNPMKDWLRGGPIAKLFRTFATSPIPPYSKWSICGYMFSYYAIALSWSVSIVSFILVGVYAITDDFFVTSWNVFFICLLLFGGLSNVANCVLRYRLKLEDAGAYAIQQLKWLLFFNVFFSGLSFSMAISLLSHLLSFDISWTSTSKEVTKSNFFLQVPKIWAAFKIQLILSFLILTGMIISTTGLIPIAYRVSSLQALIPLTITYASHLIWPFALDPYFTTFSF